ncbi:hypothetical protein [Thalassotalea sp. Y01]|uniref:DUF6942 family protein n=1 Tax=Thalassotalea sp. Y01 TaxID=2729613 RepID=UPI00145FCDEE|nr:hypothetical protein [Thalassotalea sp. Y01]NMP16647.1 hypothetical protein [Thalassotalea sp. Y01]
MDNSIKTLTGFGDDDATMRVYCQNRPPLAPFDAPEGIVPLQSGDIHYIGKHTSNHWRKIFNVYAKLGFDLSTINNTSNASIKEQRWQDYRDHRLLQQGSNSALLFAQQAEQLDVRQRLHIVMGKAYATNLLGEGFLQRCFWPTADIAICESRSIIVCPYFDYRQLTNEKIKILQSLIINMTVVKKL